jgi:hypothetical protein
MREFIVTPSITGGMIPFPAHAFVFAIFGKNVSLLNLLRVFAPVAYQQPVDKIIHSNEV